MPQLPKGNDIARPTFYMDAVPNKAASEKEGRPIFDEREMIKIELPGDKQLTFIGEVEDKHKTRWPDQYAAFKRGEQRAASGTPLDMWPNPDLTRGRLAEIKALNILSVEELAGVPDNILPRLGMNARELREQAKTYIAKAKEGADSGAMAAEIARLREMVEKLSGAAPAAPVEPAGTVLIDQMSTDQLKAVIKERTGQGVRGNPSRETLLARVAELGESQAA